MASGRSRFQKVLQWSELVLPGFSSADYVYYLNISLCPGKLVGPFVRLRAPCELLKCWHNRIYSGLFQ